MQGGTSWLLRTNAYQEYTSGYATSLVRSMSEQLFEQYCESRNDIEWVYKNGDTGQQYFSIVYIDSLRHQWLFYADYIVMKKDGTVWVIETKGGESKGKDKNIDPQIDNKFNAFKAYAAKTASTGASSGTRIIGCISTTRNSPSIWPMTTGNQSIRFSNNT